MFKLYADVNMITKKYPKCSPNVNCHHLNRNVLLYIVPYCRKIVLKLHCQI